MATENRNQVTTFLFEGVSKDGGFVFKAVTESVPYNIKIISYEKGNMEIAIDYTVSISRVAELMADLFSRNHNFSNLDSVRLNYRTISLRIERTIGREDIISMIMKAMSMIEDKDSNTNIAVDTEVCYMDYSFEFIGIGSIFILGSPRKDLCFANKVTEKEIGISFIKNGIITADCAWGRDISDFVSELKNFFVPYSNMYGIKGIEIEFNYFSILVDKINVDKIVDLYHESSAFLSIQKV